MGFGGFPDGYNVRRRIVPGIAVEKQKDIIFHLGQAVFVADLFREKLIIVGDRLVLIPK